MTMSLPPRDPPQRNSPQSLRATEHGITQRIIGAAIEVHKHLGPGLPEPVYDGALQIEFDLRGILYQRQVSVPAIYKGHVLGEYRMDFIVEETVVVEVKAVKAVTPVFEGQVLTYLRLSGKHLGLLLNFHERVLVEGIHRYVW
jgi:GxxExxY protein